MRRPEPTPVNDQFSYSFSASELPAFRVAVATCYYARLQVLNGGPWYQNEQYRIRMEVTPDVIACAIQNNIEGALIGEYGAEQGTINAAEMLNAMIDQTQQFDRTGGLSELGITVMDELYKSLAEMAYESLSQGQPLTASMNQPVH